MSITRPAELSSAPARPQRHATRPVPGPSIWLRWLLPIRLGAVLIWQAAAMAVLVSYAHRTESSGRPVFWAVAGLAGLILLSSSIRVAGLTGIERVRASIALRRRRKRYAGTASSDTVQNRLLPGLTLNTHIDRAGNRTGVIGSGLGWSAAIRIADTSTPDPDALIGAATRACLRPDLPLAAAQVLSWNVPSTWAGLAGHFAPVLPQRPDGRTPVPARDPGPRRRTGRRATGHRQRGRRAGLRADPTRLRLHGAGQFRTRAARPADVRCHQPRRCRPSRPRNPWRPRTPGPSDSFSRAASGSAAAPAEPRPWCGRPSPRSASPSAPAPSGPNGGRQPELTFLMRAAMVGQQSPITIEQASRALDRRLIPLRFRQESALQATLAASLGRPLNEQRTAQVTNVAHCRRPARPAGS